MTTERDREVEERNYLRRARLALRVQSRSGLGELTWVGPKWICALGDVDRRELEFLVLRIRQDCRLRRDIRHCRSGTHLRNFQEAAISRGLQEYALIKNAQGRYGTGVNRDVLSQRFAFSRTH